MDHSEDSYNSLCPSNTSFSQEVSELNRFIMRRGPEAVSYGGREYSNGWCAAQGKHVDGYGWRVGRVCEEGGRGFVRREGGGGDDWSIWSKMYGVKKNLPAMKKSSSQKFLNGL